MKKKSEKMFDAIGNISEDLVEEAYRDIENETLKKKRKKKGIVRWTAVAACFGFAAVFLSMTLFSPNSNRSIQSVKVDSSDVNIMEKSETIHDSGKGELVITALAAEPVKMQMKEPVKFETSFSDYSPIMSSVPGMPFMFQYESENSEEVQIVVSAKQSAMLQQWSVSDEGIWNCEKEDTEFIIKSGDQIIWKSDNGEGEIIAKVIIKGECIATRTIKIVSYDDMKYTAIME